MKRADLSALVFLLADIPEATDAQRDALYAFTASMPPYDYRGAA